MLEPLEKITAKQMNEAIQDGYSVTVIVNGVYCDYKPQAITPAELIALYNAMSADIRTMSEHNDNPDSLINELLGADRNVIETYIDTFLK